MQEVQTEHLSRRPTLSFLSSTFKFERVLKTARRNLRTSGRVTDQR